MKFHHFVIIFMLLWIMARLDWIKKEVGHIEDRLETIEQAVIK